jgi:superfamily II DNA/RNA helicase
MPDPATTASAATDAQKKKEKKQKQKEKEKEKEKKRKRADPAAVKMSTQVNLLDPKAAAASEAARPGRQAGAAGSGGADQPVPEALLPFHSAIQRGMAVKGFLEPTPIQQQCWPLLAAGRDVLGVAEPGSGKTLAYLLPGFARLLVGGGVAWWPGWATCAV